MASGERGKGGRQGLVTKGQWRKWKDGREAETEFWGKNSVSSRFGEGSLWDCYRAGFTIALPFRSLDRYSFA